MSQVFYSLLVLLVVILSCSSISGTFTLKRKCYKVSFLHQSMVNQLHESHMQNKKNPI